MPDYVLSQPDYYKTRDVVNSYRLDHTNGRQSIVGGRGSGHPGAGQQPHRIRFRNDSGETVPEWAVMRVTGMATSGIICPTITKPDTTFSRLYMVNGPRLVPPYTGYGQTGYGWGTFLLTETLRLLDQFVFYNTSSGTPAAGESWGPKNGQWALEKDYYGFGVLGCNITNRVGYERTACIQSVPELIVGKIDDTNVSKNATCTVSVWTTTFGADTGVNLTATNRVVALTSVNGKQCGVGFAGGTAYLMWVDCS